jgi:hypothetical protein
MPDGYTAPINADRLRYQAPTTIGASYMATRALLICLRG